MDCHVPISPAGPAKTGSLAGIRVVDLTRILGGPYCTQILGDHGADIIKIEPPQGDDTRTWGPPFVGDTAAYFNGMNRNKRAMVLDLKQPAAREVLLCLLSGADVMVENYKPGTLEAWGIGRDVLAARFPRLVHASVTGFGENGPLGGMPGYDAALQAASGLMSVNGAPDGPATRLGVPIVDMVTGLNATIGILLALHERTRSGLGQWIDVALFDCALSVLHPHPSNYFASGVVPGRSGNAHPNVAPYDTFTTATTPIFLAVGNDGQFAKLCHVLGAPDLAADPAYASNADRSRNRETLKPALQNLMRERDCAALADTLIRAGVPCGAVLTVAEALVQPQAVARGIVVELGAYRGVASPIKLSRTPASYDSPPPAKGQHTEEVLSELAARHGQLHLAPRL